MGAFSIWHLLVVLVIVLLVFGAGRLPNVMGDLAKGVKAFKRGLNDEADNVPPPNSLSNQTPAAPVTPAPKSDTIPHA